MDLIAGLRTFVRVVELGSFSAVAREANVSQSAVTRLIGQLEEHFDARLFHRTTRRLSVTEDGSTLLHHARGMLDDAAMMMEQLGSQRIAPTGRVRVGMPVAAALFIAPRLPLLLRAYPGLSVELLVDDQVRDMVEMQIDIAIRAGQNALRGGANADNSLIARSLGSFPPVLVAAPSYIARAGEPKTPEELTSHECIVQGTNANQTLWQFGLGGEMETVRISGTLMVNETEVARRAAIAGHGIVRMPGIHVSDDLHEGRLVRVLADYPLALIQVHLVYPSRRHLAPRTRVVLEFLAEQMEVSRLMLE